MRNSDKKTIVLVEDENVLANLLEKKFTKANYNIKLAKNGDAGLKLIKTAKPDLVLLDMALPTISGIQVLEKLREEKILPELPVIIISNSGQDVEIDKAFKLGIKDYLVKINFDPDELLEKVGMALNTGVTKPEGGSGEIAGRVLVVEDDIFLIKLLGKKIASSNIECFYTKNIAQARTILKENSIDAILLDIVMPDGNGITFLRELKDDPRLKSIPVIIISNLGQPEEIELGMESGAVEYLVKANTTPGEIVEKVKKLLSKRK